MGKYECLHFNKSKLKKKKKKGVNSLNVEPFHSPSFWSLAQVRQLAIDNEKITKGGAG